MRLYLPSACSRNFRHGYCCQFLRGVAEGQMVRITGKDVHAQLGERRGKKGGVM